LNLHKLSLIKIKIQCIFDLRWFLFRSKEVLIWRIQIISKKINSIMILISQSFYLHYLDFGLKVKISRKIIIINKKLLFPIMILILN